MKTKMKRKSFQKWN